MPSPAVRVKIVTQKVPISTLTTSYLKNTPTIISIPLFISLKYCFLIFFFIFFFFFHFSLSLSALPQPQPISDSDDAEIGFDGDGVVDGGVDFGVGEEGNGVLGVEHLTTKLVGLGVDEDELIDGLHVCTYQAFFKSLNFYLHLPTHTQDPEPVRSMVASRAAGVASSRRQEWPSVRGGQRAGARRRR
jgi:hypothetical protein